uniref:Uncharacterized protein n=1 Tax=Arundo donax TaxID=35708 RepID=A0A0A9ARL9_ARUDO
MSHVLSSVFHFSFFLFVASLILVDHYLWQITYSPLESIVML